MFGVRVWDSGAEKREGGVRETEKSAGSVVFNLQKAREKVKESGGNQD